MEYVYEDDSGWHIGTVVDNEGAVGSTSSVALDGGGNPHIAYSDDDNDDLKYAYHDDFGWHTLAIDSEGIVGYYASLALDEVWPSPHKLL